MKSRIEFLDGLRGIAIILVIAFHAYARWHNYVPYKREFTGWLFIQEGWLGVYLFFIISGFVILMTLEKCQRFWQFMWRRWLRLFPAMLIASLLILLVSSFMSEGPRGPVGIKHLLPGITFIDPTLWKALFGVQVESLEFAFWSLYVEMKFYVFAALIYFWKGKNALLVALVSVFAFTLAINLSSLGLPDSLHQWLKQTTQVLSFRYFGWFAIGALYYCFYTTRKPIWFITASLLGLLCSVYVLDMTIATRPAIMGVITVAFFAAALLSPHLQALLSNRLLLFIGAISYPFYLIHENAMIAMTVKTYYLRLPIPDGATPFPGIALLVLVAYLIAKFGEPTLRHFIKKRSISGS